MDLLINMKKALFLFLFILIAFDAHAQDNVLYEPANDGIRYFRPKSDIKTPEIALFFVRVGKSMQSNDAGQNQINSFGSFGHRRIADTLIYGFEYTYHYVGGTRFSNYDLNVGYRPNLNHKVIPYIIGGFGLTSSSVEESFGKEGGGGINYFLDLGIEMWRIDIKSVHFRTMSGLKFTKEKLSGGQNNNIEFTDFYFGLGFGW